MPSFLDRLPQFPPPCPSWMNDTVYYLLVNVIGSLTTGVIGDAICQIVETQLKHARRSSFDLKRTGAFAVGVAAVCGPLAMVWYRRVFFKLPIPSLLSPKTFRIIADALLFGAVYVAAGFVAVTAIENVVLKAARPLFALRPWLSAYSIYAAVWLALDLLIFNKLIPQKLTVMAVSGVRTAVVLPVMSYFIHAASRSLIKSH